MAKKYINVSYQDRDLAKKLGAKWDPSVRRWYCPSGSNLAKIFSWRQAAHAEAARMAANHNALMGERSTRPTPPNTQASLFDLSLAS
ncbi:DUF5710 domain-containing protein [Litorimonas sp. RW-G-Af-16]|uniref:DUF5710 domain-containing protein n=1 Tax=Litorimonas sp. RW-G-Af-16 TaxID=3241168 RepID=UPI00390C706B